MRSFSQILNGPYMVPNISARHEMPQKKMISVAIPCLSGSKSKMAAKIQQKISFLCITMRIIDLAEKCLSTKRKSVKNATFFFFTQTSSSKTVEDMTILDLGRVSRPKIWEIFLTVTHVKI